MEKEIYFGLQKALNEKQEAALITVTGVLGSVPRKPGAKMLVLADGTTIGTIGGGCGEAEGRQEALQVIAAARAKPYELNMTAEMAEEEGMVCGGIMELFIDYLGFEASEKEAELYEKYLKALQETENPTMVTVIAAENEELIGKKLFVKGNGETTGDLGVEALNTAGLENAQIELKGFRPQRIALNADFEPSAFTERKAAYRLFIEPASAEVRLLILGAGHIAMPLALMAKVVGYEVTVVDDRLAFANYARFPTADEVICNDFAAALDGLEITPQTFVVVITRGHRYDKVCLQKVLGQPAAYIGMIGSRKRVKALFAELEEEGVPKELLQKIYSPIGLKIGAETPEELAVCILGELIQVQRGA